MNLRVFLVASAYSEPSPGWIDEKISTSGDIAAVGKGLKSVAFGKEYELIPIISVDSVIRGMITIAWDIGQRKQKFVIFPNDLSNKFNFYFILICFRPKTLPIYHVIWPYIHNMVWNYKNIMKFALEKLKKDPFKVGIGFPSLYVTSSKLVYNTLFFTRQLIPSLMFDGILFLLKCKPM